LGMGMEIGEANGDEDCRDGLKRWIEEVDGWMVGCVGVLL
jgi:hypothetical protein